MNTVFAVDLFAGAGGTSSGLAHAVQRTGRKVDLVAINHWKLAISTHQAAHPWARHLCEKIESLNPREVVPGQFLNILAASPECTHHSVARGGKPINDQSRASAWHVPRWLEHLDVQEVVIENVPEFQTWGPLGIDGRQDPDRKGAIYQAYLESIRAFGYKVEARVLNSADFGAATSRRRLFIRASKVGNVRWPVQTHSKRGPDGLPTVAGTLPWRGAREIIDWSLQGKSIFDRKKPLSEKTMKRILIGLEKYGGPELKPFLVILRGGPSVRSSRSLEDPAPSQTAQGTHLALASFTLSQASGGAPREVGEPLPTMVSGGGGSIVNATVIDTIGSKDTYEARALDPANPIGAISSESGRFALARAEFTMSTGTRQSNSPPKGVDDPLPTVMPNSRQNVFQADLIVTTDRPDTNRSLAKDMGEPVPTVVGSVDRIAHVSAAIVPNFGEAKGQEPRAHSIEEPTPSVTGRGAGNLVEGVVVQYNGTSDASPVTAPLPTATSVARFGLVRPVIDGKALDIRFRMLEPHELAGAQGFDKEYPFQGNKRETIKQIGNAVEVHMSDALCSAALDIPQEGAT